MTRPGSLLIVVAVAVAALLALVRLPSTVRMLDNRAATGSGLTGLDRELPAAQQYGIPVDAVQKLKELIPPNAVYAIEMPGQGADTGALAFPGIVGNALLPRRNALNGGPVRFVVGYHVALPTQFGNVLDVGGGVKLERVQR